jgi:hypothetical protein
MAFRFVFRRVCAQEGEDEDDGKEEGNVNKLPTGRRRCAVTKKYKGDTKYTKTITSLTELNRSCMLSLNYCLMLFFFRNDPGNGASWQIVRQRWWIWGGIFIYATQMPRRYLEGRKDVNRSRDSGHTKGVYSAHCVARLQSGWMSI